jgi:hypothetical protein
MAPQCWVVRSWCSEPPFLQERAILVSQPDGQEGVHENDHDSRDESGSFERVLAEQTTCREVPYDSLTVTDKSEVDSVAIPGFRRHG